MENQVPICSHTFQFYNGSPSELDDLERKFKKALNAHVKYFGPSGKSSQFVVFINSKGSKEGDRLREVLIDHFKIYQKRTIEKMMPDDETVLLRANDMVDTFKDSFTFNAYVTDGLDEEQLQDLVFSTADESPEAVDSEGNHCFLFDITNARPEQAFTVCKLTAIQPIYTVAFSQNDVGESTSYIMPPFPRHYLFTKQQQSVLSFLAKKFNGEDVNDSYWLYKQICDKVGGMPKRPNSKFMEMIPRFVVKKKMVPNKDKTESEQGGKKVPEQDMKESEQGGKKVPEQVLKEVNCYCITREGMFMYRYLTNDYR